MRPLERAHVPTNLPPCNPIAGQQTASNGASLRDQAGRVMALQKTLRAATRQGKYEIAIRILDHLIKLHPDRAEYYNNRGLMYYYCRQWSRAIANYNRALALHPNDDRIYNNRANCQAAQKKWSVAIADYERSIDLNPFNAQARINQGIAFRDMGQYDDALVCFDIALFFRPALAVIYAERGRTYALQGHWNCAMGDYQRALNVHSKLDSSQSRKQQLLLRNRIYRWIGELVVGQGSIIQLPE